MSLAVVSGHHSPVVYAVAGLYTLSAIYSASFHSSRAFCVYLVGLAAMSWATLVTTGIPGALAGWAVLVGTTTTVGIMVHVMQQALRTAATTDPLTGLVNRRALEPTSGASWLAVRAWAIPCAWPSWTWTTSSRSTTSTAIRLATGSWPR